MNKKLTFLTVLLAALFLTVSVNAQGRIDLGKATESGVTLNSSTMTGFTSTFSFNSIESDLISNEKGQFSELFIDGSFPNGEVGAPELPMITRLIAIPDGATPMVTVSSYSEKEYKLSDYGIGKLSAMQPPIRKNVDPSTVEYAMDANAYAHNSYNDDPIAMVEVLGTMRGLTLGKLIVRPVRYNPVAGMVKVYNDIDVKVQFKNGDAASTAEMFSNTFSPAFNGVYDQIFNMNMFYENGSKDAYTDHPDKYHTPVKMLVICYSGFKNNSDLNAWLQWKLQKGYYVDIYYTDETGTTASAIASFIKSKYNASVSAGNAYTYLIVIGDVDQVTYYAREYESDIYDYCALDLGYSSVNYASNTNNYFPDMFYSRMSVQNATNLANYINKVLTYEKYQFSDGGNYLNNVILVGGWDSYWTSKIAKPTINYATNNYFNSTNNTYGGFSGGTIKATISTSATAGYSGSNNGCYQGINNGACLVNYTAHGDRQEWYQPKMTATHVSQLTNTGKYFFGVGNCCLTGNFNNTSTDYSPGSTIGSNACFAEAMIRVPNAGAVAYIGCSEESLWYEDFYWAVGAHSYSAGNAPTVSNSTMGAYDAMFNDQYWNSAAAILYVGNLAVQQAINNNNTNSGSSFGAKYYFKFYHTFGDASIMPFVTKPEVNNVTIPSTLAGGATTMTVNAVAGSYVAVTNNTNTIYGVGVTNSSGVATVSLSGVPSSGTLYVVVTRQQYQPYFGTVTISGGSTDVCYAPTNLTATSTSSAIILSWTASSTATSYRVYRNGTSIANNITGTSYTDNTAVAGTTYSYTVRANCSNGSLSDPSNSVSATVSGGDCNVYNDIYETACDSYTWNGQTYTQSGDYVQTFPIGGDDPGTCDENSPFNNSFEGSLGNWTTLDADGDGYNWGLASVLMDGYIIPYYSGEDCICSESYHKEGTGGTALTPDNYLISPKTMMTGAQHTLSFWACAQDASWAAEHFGVAVSTTNNTNANAFTTIQEWTMTAKNMLPREQRPARGEGNRESGAWYNYTVDLSNYIGQEIYVAIRHFGCTDMFYLDVDQIEFVCSNGGGGQTDCTPNTNFNNDFENGLGNWTVLDADGDGYEWFVLDQSVDNLEYNAAHTGDGWATSASYLSDALTPNNFLISPKTLMTAQQHTLTFWASAQDASYPSEHFGVGVSTTTATASAFTMVQEWDMTAKSTIPTSKKATRNGTRDQGAWYQYTVDLSNYIGQEIYVAIRHFNCTDWFRLNVDDIELACSSKYEPTRNCDSIVTLHLTINEPPTITITGNTNPSAGSPTTLTASGASTYVWNTGATTASITVSPTQTTTYTVTGTDANGCTNTATVTITPTQGIDETDNTVSIFPNPVEDLVTVKARNIERICLFNITGQLIIDTDNSGDKATIDMSGIAPGQYFLQVSTKNNVITRKVTKR